MLKDTGKGDFQQPPEDTHVAVCIRLIDLGTQNEEYLGKKKQVEQLMIGWELPNALMDDGRPFMVSRIYTKSLNEKANLRSDLENWRGKDFTEEELKGFDERKLLGKACLLQIIHKKKQGGGTTAKVSAVMKLPAGTTPPAPKNELLHFSLEPEHFKPELYEKLTEWTRKKIALSPEYAERVGGKKPEPPAAKPAPHKAFEDFEEDVPF